MNNINQGPLDVLVEESGKESLLVEGVEVVRGGTAKDRC